MPVSLIGKVGSGIMGRAVLEILESHAPGSSRSMSVVPGEDTSYTVVLNLSGKDRMFLHCPGANATFGSWDVPDDQLKQVKWMHLGYPPLLARMYEDDGSELESLFRRAKAAGATTSLDLSLPDPRSPSGRANWERILARVLPYVDFFLPSVEELLFMLDRTSLEAASGGLTKIGGLIERSLAFGARNVGLKLGERGFILRLGSGQEGAGRGAPAWSGWVGRSIWHPSYQVEVAGTTGAGDATIAGFIFGCLRGFDPLETCQAAVASGACCCESPDAIGGVRSWGEIKARIDSGWVARPLDPGDGWQAERSAFSRLKRDESRAPV